MTLNVEYGLPTICKDCEVVECFYCGNPLSKRHEHDHFPVPARAGGNHVVAACYNCHDLKDRMTVGEWPVSMQVLGCHDLLTALAVRPETLPVETIDHPERAMAHVFARVVHNLDLHNTPAWRRLSVSGRLLFAKMACLMTGDYPAQKDWQRARRRELLAPWVDRDDPRYSDDGPTLRIKGESGSEVLLKVLPGGIE